MKRTPARISVASLLATALCAASMPAVADIEAVTTTVTNLRVESSYGFIGTAQPLPTCGGRVWVDMNSVLGRAAYSTAMMAFAMGKTVAIRAYTESTHVFGACNLYDIYVTQ